ncbi:MAG: DUF3800 domain-containing protein [Candidatus Sulfotelmatobacter sp.]
MSLLINVYCDESSHLENDSRSFMALGALSCPNNKVRDFARLIRGLKIEHGLPEKQELKWVSVAPSNVRFYESVVRLFFESDALRFRVVVADKRCLDHDAFDQTHDEWYYKMYYQLLTRILEQKNRYEIYLDLKDTLGGRKVRKLGRVLSNAMWDFDQESIVRIEQVRSHESALLQLTDILIGAVGSVHCGNGGSAAKERIIRQIRELSHFSLSRTTSLAEQKFNIFCWSGREA